MNVMDVIHLVERLLGWKKRHSNPARQQADRVLQAFEAHGVPRMQINQVLPQTLRLTAMAWSDPDELKTVLHQEHIDWLAERFKLKHDWLAGLSNSANELIFSYKQPGELNRWFERNRQQGSCFEFKLHLITFSADQIGAHSTGPFALVLEQLPDDDSASRFYHLSDGSHFDHYPCLVNLQQVLAIAHYYHSIMWRSTLGISELDELSLNHGLIAKWLECCRSNPLAADHELWPHFSGNSPWLMELRQEAEQGLLAAGLDRIVEQLHIDEARFARP